MIGHCFVMFAGVLEELTPWWNFRAYSRAALSALHARYMYHSACPTMNGSNYRILQ